MASWCMVPKWSTLRPVGNLWVTRLTVLIPIVGYMIIFNSELARYMELIAELSSTQPQHFHLSVPPRLFQMYFGLCFIATGSVIYSLCCPAIVKRNASEAEFAGSEGPHIGKFAMNAIYERIEKSGRGGEFSAFQTSESSCIDQYYPESMARGEIRNAAVHIYFDIENARWCIARLASSLFFLIGFPILLWPSFQVFMKVVDVLRDLYLAR